MDLSRRITVYYTLFCVVSAIALGCGVFLATQQYLNARAQTRCLALIGRTSPALVLQQLRGDEDGLQESVQRLQLEESLEYVSVVSSDGVYLAHSSPEIIGTVAPSLDGRRELHDAAEEITYEDEQANRIREFRAPLKSGTTDLGALHLAIREADMVQPYVSISGYYPLLLLAPAILLAFGLLVIRRTMSPIAEVDNQLRSFSADPAAGFSGLQSVEANTAATFGWNRIVQQLHDSEQNTSGPDELMQAVREYRHDKVYQVLDSLPDGIALADSDGNIKFINRILVALFSGDEAQEDLTGCNLIEKLREWSTEEGTGEATATGGLEFARSASIGDRVLKVSSFDFHDGDSRRSDQVWTVRDITQQRLTDKMRDEFLDCATHELRTPLANIKAYAETLALSEVLDIEQQKEFCNTINAEATRLARFIDDLLSISSVETGSLTVSRENVDLSRMLQEIIGKIKPTLDKKQIELEVSLPEKLPEVQLDKDKIQVCLVNLLGNAAKYTPEGGRVEVVVKMLEDVLTVAVQDTGVGISEEELPRIFDKFFRSDNEYVRSETGTGLGLSLAREIVQLHGGEITVESENDKGSTFSVTLPVKIGRQV
ncbi:MAG: ATP-binding protein [Planctomycetota bacterium]